ncbi:MAG: NAD(P)H-dependent oxidoreductase subunit E [Bacteroidales bacterium]
MKKILIEICVGTSCYVMGASELMLIEEHLSPLQKEKVEVKGTTCLDVCQNKENGHAPFVRVDGDVYANMNVERLLHVIDERIRHLE